MFDQKKYGQYFTNKKIARFMTNWVMDCFPKTLLDPAVGKGIFIDEIFQIDKNISITAFDIDKKMCDITKYKHPTANVINEDYIRSNETTYDAVICNPPYNKFQKIKNRHKIIEHFLEKYNIQLSGYSNLYIYFLIKSIAQLSQNGRCSYIIPYEFINTGYGKIVKKYLLESKKLVSIIKFDNTLNLFEGAITTSCILLIENKVHEQVNFINICDLTELEKFDTIEHTITYNYSCLNANEKWIKYFTQSKNNTYTNLIPLKDIAIVKRGIATGNNNYFSLNNQKIQEFGLSSNVCLPCITKSADITVPIFDKFEFKKLVDSNKKIYLFNGIKSSKNNDLKYIKLGEISGFNKTYLTSHRTPWFSIENKEPAPILLSVFCRNKIKVIRNKLMIKNLTTFHGLYFNNNISEEAINIYFCYLLTPIAQQILFLNKREYGNGLDKFEPNDFNNAYILNINSIKINDKKTILKIYDNLKKENLDDNILKLNKIFCTYLLAKS